jgi:hypothetical protein
VGLLSILKIFELVSLYVYFFARILSELQAYTYIVLAFRTCITLG